MRKTADGDWQVLDTMRREDRARRRQRSTAASDGRAQAEAIARDYLTAGRFMVLARGATAGRGHT